MALKVSENSLFAMLLRSPWWYSVAVALIPIALGVAIAEAKYLPLGVFSALPFLGIASYAGYKQSQRPNTKRILEVAEQARGMSAAEVAEKISVSYEKERFESVDFKGHDAELELTRSHLKLLLCSKRFKAATAGIEQLKKLVAAGESVEATGYLYVTLGEVSDSARKYAKQNNIELIQAESLAAHFDGQAKIEL